MKDMTLTAAQENYFGTLSECVQACQVRMDLAGIVPIEHWNTHFSEPVNYGQTYKVNFQIETIKGKPTHKWYHVSIYRLDSGNYELTTYVL